MSDAPAAPVTENGVPPVAQESTVEETPVFKVFAGNLAYSTTDDGLKTFFAPVEADILTAQVIHRGPRSAGYGFVSLTNAEAVQRAIELLNKKELDGREILVEIAKPADQKDKEKKQKKYKRRPGRRGGKAVPGEISEAEANGDAEKSDQAAATPATGDAAKPKKKKKSARKNKRKTSAAGDATPAEGAEAAEGATTDAAAATKKPRARKPRAPRPPRPAGEDPVGELSTTTLFVANLGFSIDDAGLATLFTDAGLPVNSARIVRRRWGKPRRSKGYGFVDVGNPEEQKKGIELLDGKEVSGRPIAVKIAVNTQLQEAAAENAEAEKVENAEATAEEVAVAAAS